MKWTAARRRWAGWLGATVIAASGASFFAAGSGSRESTGAAVAAETIISIDGGSAPPAIRHIGPVGPASRSDDAAVDGVLADLNAYWAATLPQLFGTPFRPLAGYASIDSTAAAGTSFCISSPDQIAGNAYYCPSGDAIVYDSAGLIPVLLGHYGVAALTAALAHEFGHAIQARIGPTAAQRSADPPSYPGILVEAQGDCYAGSFLAWVVGGHATHVRLPASSMIRAVAPLLDFRDPVATAVADPTAHGLSLDRLTAILLGYSGGALACHRLTRSAISPTLGRAGLVTRPAADRFAGTTAALAAGRSTIESFASTLPNAAHSAFGPVQPSAADLAAAAPYGQFADAATLALAIGLVVTGTPVGAACFTGAWTASVFGHAATGRLGAWAGDADEALDMMRARPTATFDELAGYADGFAKGRTACR